MDEDRPASNRTRVLFALVGIAACLVGALCAEALLGRLNAGARLRRYHAPSILYRTEPAVVRTTLPALPPPPSDRELQRRLDLVGAASGDVQISLAWNNRNDLDLSCIDPFGEMIDGYNQASRSGGVLDVDMNVTPTELLSPAALQKLRRREGGFNFAHRSRMSSEPVENLIWASNAPVGHYKVFVHQFCNKENTAQTPFWVVVRVHNQVHRITGTVGREDFATNLVDPKLVYEFDVEPAAAVSVPVAAPVTPAPAAPLPPRIVTHVAYSLQHLDFALLTAGLWGALIGLLPLALLSAQRVYLRLPLFYGFDDLAVIIGGPATGFMVAIVGQLALALPGAALRPGALPVLFAIAWTLFGAIFGVVLSLYTPNVSRSGALIAGAASALAGSILFLFLAPAGLDLPARLFCAAVIGGAIGALNALPERESEPEPVPEVPRETYEVEPPFIVRGTRTRKVGGLRQTGRRAD